MENIPSLSSRAVVAKMGFKLMGLTERDEKASRSVNNEFLHVSNEAGHYQKVRMDRKDLSELLPMVERARAYYRDKTRPFGDDGVRLLPATKVFEYTKQMGEFKREFEAALQITKENWDSIVERQRDRLQHLFNPKSYPPASEIGKKFRMTWSIQPVPDWSAASDQNHILLQIDEDLAKDIEAQVKEDQLRALYESQDVLWMRLIRVLEKVVERYSDPAAQVYRSSLVNIEKTVEIVRDLNFTDDPDVTTICREIEDTILGWTPAQVRKDADLKLKLARRAEAICAKIKARMEAGYPIA